MKATEKASLIALASGVIAGCGLAYFLPEAHWGVWVAFGFIVTGGAYSGITKQMATDRIADGDAG